ncbi:MAG: hypothetical protein CEN91_254, partial [Candidatus Berkelbacteria bacterium Licking1014_85]
MKIGSFFYNIIIVHNPRSWDYRKNLVGKCPLQLTLFLYLSNANIHNSNDFKVR